MDREGVGVCEVRWCIRYRVSRGERKDRVSNLSIENEVARERDDPLGAIVDWRKHRCVRGIGPVHGCAKAHSSTREVERVDFVVI